MNAESSEGGSEQPTADGMRVMLHSPGYLSLLAIAALVGIPVSVIAFAFLAVVHQLEHYVWDVLPEDLGFHGPPTWWPIVALGLAGVLVGLAVTHLPGRGGHVPAEGMHAGATAPNVIPGVVLAATASLALGAVVGPEAPLLAIGSGLAALGITWTKAGGNPTAVTMLGAAGSAAAISVIFGSPLVAAIMFLEVLGLARRQSMLVILPCLVSSGVGALVFTGLGNWTGLEIGALSIPDLKSAHLEAGELFWALPLAAVVAGATWCVFVIGRQTAALASSRTLFTTVGAGLLAGCSAAVYAVATDHSPADVALSGQATLSTLATHPEQWSTGALVLLLACKGLAYALCIGVFRGGPVFPALFLGAASGTLASALIPSINPVAGLAIGMAAGTAVMAMPVTSVVLVTILLGDAAFDYTPVIILAAVTALVVEEFLTSPRADIATPDRDRSP